MLLKANLLITVLFASLSVSANTSKSSGMQSDIFVLDPAASNLEEVQKSKNLCAPEIKFSKSQLAGSKLVSIGRYDFYTENKAAPKVTPSDIDPGLCKFIEWSMREDEPNTDPATGRTKLTRINIEYCGGKARSTTTAMALIDADRIELRYEVHGAEPYTCVWTRKP